MLFTYLWIFLIILLNFIVAKRLKYFRLGYSAKPTYSDIFYSFILTFATLVLCYYNLQISVILFFSVLYILLFFDVVLFQVYSINLDYSALKLFFQNYKDFLKTADSSFWQTVHYRKFYLYPLFTVLSIFFISYDFNNESYLVSFYIIYLIFTIAKMRFNIFNTILFLILSVLLGFYTQKILVLNYFQPSGIALLSVLGVFILLLTIKYITRTQDHFFFKNSCKMLDFLNLNTLEFIKPTHVYKDHHHICSLNYTHPPLSKQIPKLDNPNIILITIESLSKEVFETIQNDYFKKFQITSDYHHAISANTYESLHTLYNGTYYESHSYPHLEVLKDAGYKTVFFTSQETQFENTTQLLQNAGFQDIISADNQANEDSAWSHDDMQFYLHHYTKLHSKIQGKKYFLHILNAQTHIPYTTYNHNINVSTMNTKQRYKASLQESLHAIETLLDKLQEDALLENTMIILTGDHGESFGELNYKAHSTAITKEQLCVPFSIWHKDFTKKMKIDFSTHFDIFPTIYDFLRVQPDNNYLGTSIFSKQKEGVIVYTKTKINGLPTSFGYLDSSQKIIVDLIYDRYWITNLDDNITHKFQHEQKKEIMWTLYTALQNRSII